MFAAASLTEAFTTLGHRFEAAHPGTHVVFNFAGSSALATQITQGAPADVFASASAKNMDQVVVRGRSRDPRTFAREPAGDRRTAGQPGATSPGWPTWPSPA